MQAVIICNPAAAAGRARARMSRLLDEVEAWPWSSRLLWTGAAGDAVDLARQARAAGATVVIAAGGDGTANEVINGLLVDGAEGAPIFAYLALGGGCDLARALGVRRGRAAARALSDWQVANIDVGTLQRADDACAPVRYFINALNVGLATSVLARVKGSPVLRRLGAASYVLASVREILTASPVQVRLQLDAQGAREGRVLNLSVCNGPFFGGGLRPCPGAHLQSGRLHVAWIDPLAPAAAVLRLPRLMRGDVRGVRAIRQFDCRSLELHGGPIEVELDGELAGTLPVRVAVLAGALRALVGRLPAAASIEADTTRVVPSARL